MNFGRYKKIVNGFVAALIAMTAFPISARAAAYPPADKFVRTATPFMQNVYPENYDALAKFDLITLPVELQVNQPHIFQELRKRNPDIILLAYLPTKSYILGWGDSLHLSLRSGLEDGWWLRNTNGSPISVWPGTQALSITTGWKDYLPQFAHDRVLSTGLWDGIFYDEVSAEISWANNGNVDLNRDGIIDDAATMDLAWKNGISSMLKTARALDPGKIFVMNGSSAPELQEAVNGRMFETFPTPWEANGDWYEIMRRYIANEPVVSKPSVFIINSNAGNTGNEADYQKMRFGLASTLMGNGFYSFDDGDQSHTQTWWYDEYDTTLGLPTGDPVNTESPADSRWRAGVWQRDYQNGIALVNPTNTAKSVTFDSEYEKLHGTQDPATNDGSIVSTVTIPAKDGLVMLRPLDKLTDAVYVNGAFVRIFDDTGAAVRTGFFAYDGRFRGSTAVLEKDLDNDGRKETTVADKTNIRVYGSDNAVKFTLAPFGSDWKNGMEIGVGDVNGDGANEIVAAAGAGGAPQVKIYRIDGTEVSGFLAYNKSFRGGVHLAVGNVNGDGKAEIVTGAGAGGGPHVRVFDEKGIVKYQFFAYAQTFTGGAYVAVGDTNGSGYGQIVTGAGFGGGPHVRVFDVTKQNKVIGQFFAFDQKLRSGVRVTTADTNGSGRAQIIGESTDVFTISSAGTPKAEIVLPRTDEVRPLQPETEVAPQIPELPLFLGMNL